MAVKTKWAIIGTGYIANQFASGMRAVEDADSGSCCFQK